MTTITRKILPIDTPNHNGRIYPRATVEKMIDKFNSRRDDQPLLGEIGIPSPTGTSIELDRISHEVDEIFIEGDDVMAKITVLNTPMGKILKTLIEEVPVSVGFAPRGTGKVDEGGNVSDYKLLTVDIAQNAGTD